MFKLKTNVFYQLAAVNRLLTAMAIFFHHFWKYSIIFVQWFGTSSFAFTSGFVSQNFCEYGSPVYFRVQIRLRKSVCFIFCETQNCVKKSFRIALV
jgi:hypothetical protein